MATWGFFVAEVWPRLSLASLPVVATKNRQLSQVSPNQPG
jgi:hypothetical protein